MNVKGTMNAVPDLALRTQMMDQRINPVQSVCLSGKVNPWFPTEG